MCKVCGMVPGTVVRAEDGLTIFLSLLCLGGGARAPFFILGLPTLASLQSSLHSLQADGRVDAQGPQQEETAVSCCVPSKRLPARPKPSPEPVPVSHQQTSLRPFLWVPACQGPELSNPEPQF